MRDLLTDRDCEITLLEKAILYYHLKLIFHTISADYSQIICANGMKKAH